MSDDLFYGSTLEEAPRESLYPTLGEEGPLEIYRSEALLSRQEDMTMRVAVYLEESGEVSGRALFCSPKKQFIQTQLLCRSEDPRQLAGNINRSLQKLLALGWKGDLWDKKVEIKSEYILAALASAPHAEKLVPKETDRELLLRAENLLLLPAKIFETADLEKRQEGKKLSFRLEKRKGLLVTWGEEEIVYQGYSLEESEHLGVWALDKMRSMGWRGKAPKAKPGSSSSEILMSAPGRVSTIFWDPGFEIDAQNIRNKMQQILLLLESAPSSLRV